MKVLETTLGNLIDNLDWHYLSLLAEALRVFRSSYQSLSKYIGNANYPSSTAISVGKFAIYLNDTTLSCF
jgi:hypothetical protein